MTLKASVAAELADMPERLRSGPLASLATLLAGRLEKAPATAIAPISRQLVQVLGLLRAEKAKMTASDTVDELKARRKARRAGVSDGSGKSKRVVGVRGGGSGRVGRAGARRGAD